MKNTLSLLTICFLFVIASGCTKNSDISKNILAAPETIYGKWELRQSAGGRGIKDYPPGNGVILQFADSTYSTAKNDLSFFVQSNHPENGYYQVAADTTVSESTGLSVPAGQFSEIIILNKDTTGNKVFYQITGNELVIITGYFPVDGGVQFTFQKQ